MNADETELLRQAIASTLGLMPGVEALDVKIKTISYNATVEVGLVGIDSADWYDSSYASTAGNALKSAFANLTKTWEGDITVGTAPRDYELRRRRRLLAFENAASTPYSATTGAGKKGKGPRRSLAQLSGSSSPLPSQVPFPPPPPPAAPFPFPPPVPSAAEPAAEPAAPAEPAAVAAAVPAAVAPVRAPARQATHGRGDW